MTLYYVKYRMTTDDFPKGTSLKRRMLFTRRWYRKDKTFETLEEAEQFYNRKLEEGKEPRLFVRETDDIWRDLK